MNTGGEAAEQIVRMSLEGFEVAAKITGAGAKNIAILLYSILKEEQKTKGKARLTNMLRSGKELKVFTVRNSDLKKFTQEAKKYGVLYCVLADRKNKDPNAEVDVIARAEDASKISRIAERFKLASEATASVVTDVEKAKDEKAGQSEPDVGVQDKAEISDISGRLKVIRKEVRLCEGIAARSDTLKEKLQTIRADENEQRRKELIKNEHRRRSGRTNRPNELGGL